MPKKSSDYCVYGIRQFEGFSEVTSDEEDSRRMTNALRKWNELGNIKLPFASQDSL